jgi:hypothetical protein
MERARRYGQAPRRRARGATRHLLSVNGDWYCAPELENHRLTHLEVSGRRWLLFSQFDVESPGDMTVLASEDDGYTFIVRSTISWPSYLAYPDGIAVTGNDVTISVQADDEISLHRDRWYLTERVESWLAGLFDRASLWSEKPPGHRPAGSFTLRSDDAGRTFELE